ncbi:tRNA (adenosine(37)-N6)-threonylcarbamoyltransferase complex ATPase subunit type 1 TsaE, partial [Vibrio parahaemolyticus]|nr:tRNA (adenosine(37)-N6)-threonylcarbamoyltransferase complex ATPase subunit type 1 TsaE [Vibrio parahaemolyticus]
FTDDAICLVEWPEKGQGLLQQPDLDVEIRYKGEQRVAEITANNDYGVQLLSRLDLC